MLLVSLPTVVFCLIVLELAFRFVIPATEVPHRYVDPESRVLRYEPYAEGLWTAGKLAQERARWRMNNEGWNSAVDYLPPEQRTKPLVAVIGDSYVEAFQVDPDESFVALLREELGGEYDVYGFGMSGAPLSQYLHMSRYVKRRFDPDVLVFNLVHNDLDESLRTVVQRPYFLQLRPDGEAFAETSPTVEEVPLKRVLTSSALARYLLYQLKVTNIVHSFRSPGEDRYNANVDVAAVNARRKEIRRATTFLMERIRREHPRTPILVVMDAPRADLYAGTLERSSIRWMNEVVRDAALRSDMSFLDLTPAFQRAYQRGGKRFESPYDGHWNERGHAVVAGAVGGWLAAGPGATVR